MKYVLNSAATFTLASLIAVTLGACGGAQSEDEDSNRLSSAFLGTDFTDDGQYVRRFDANFDTRADMLVYYIVLDENDDPVARPQDAEYPDVSNLQLVRKEMDVNFDSMIDMVRVYDRFQNLETEQADVDWDGTIDVTTYYRDAAVIRRELDNNLDGTTDEFRYYRSGAVQRVETDTDFDGVLDYFAYYNGTNLVRTGRDFDGMEPIDEWTRYREPPRTQTDVTAPPTGQTAPGVEGGDVESEVNDEDTESDVNEEPDPIDDEDDWGDETEIESDEDEMLDEPAEE